MTRSTICYQHIHHMILTCFGVQEKSMFLPSPLLMFAVLKRFCLFWSGLHKRGKHHRRQKFNVHITWICLILMSKFRCTLCPYYLDE
jgi:hypothetical protein